MKRTFVGTTDGKQVEVLIPENTIEAAAIAQYGTPPSFADVSEGPAPAPALPEPAEGSG